MTNARATDVWIDGDSYEQYVGRWSRQIAEPFLQWLSLPTGFRWLDVGCGTGALLSAILRTAQPTEAFGVDPSEGFLAIARERLQGRATLLLGSAAQIPLPNASVDVAVSGLALNFV